MTSLLVSGIKTKVAAAFKGKLTLGTIRRETTVGLNALGDPTTPTVTTFSFEGIREDFSKWYKAQSGIPETDVGILVLLGSVVPATTPKQDDLIFLSAPWSLWYKVRNVLSIDPAGATARLQAYEVPAP